MTVRSPALSLLPAPGLPLAESQPTRVTVRVLSRVRWECDRGAPLRRHLFLNFNVTAGTQSANDQQGKIREIELSRSLSTSQLVTWDFSFFPN